MAHQTIEPFCPLGGATFHAWVKDKLQVYYFEFDSATSPIFGQVYTFFESLGAGLKESSEISDMGVYSSIRVVFASKEFCSAHVHYAVV